MASKDSSWRMIASCVTACRQCINIVTCLPHTRGYCLGEHKSRSTAIRHVFNESVSMQDTWFNFLFLHFLLFKTWRAYQNNVYFFCKTIQFLHNAVPWATVHYDRILALLSKNSVLFMNGMYRIDDFDVREYDSYDNSFRKSHAD